jgi:hypothetical protein
MRDDSTLVNAIKENRAQIHDLAPPTAGAQLDRIVAAQELGSEEAEVGHKLAIEIPLAQPALHLDEAQIDVEAKYILELMTRGIRELTAQPAAPCLNKRADLADELRSSVAKLLETRDLSFDGFHVFFGALGLLT